MFDLFRNCFVRTLFLLSLSTPVAAYATGQTANEILTNLAIAAGVTDYKGTFLYSSGKNTETMQIYHSAMDGEIVEKLIALNGDSSELIRTDQGVWCYFHRDKVGYFKFGDSRIFRTPGLHADSLHDLDAYYKASTIGEERIAGRLSKRIALQANDQYRYGFELWVDRESGLLLRSDLFDENLKMLDRYMFVDISIDEMITENDLKPKFSGSDYVWNFDKMVKMKTLDGDSHWNVGWVPDGFTKKKHVLSQEGTNPKEHFVYSDNLAKISIFVQPLLDASPEIKFEGSSQMGAINAWGKVLNNNQVTVIGSVPADTVRLIGESISLNR